MKLPDNWHRWALNIACGFALLGLALIVWSILDPRPVPVMAAMMVGQGFGTGAFVLYLVVVLNDLRRKKVLEVPGIEDKPEEKKT